MSCRQGAAAKPVLHGLCRHRLPCINYFSREDPWTDEWMTKHIRKLPLKCGSCCSPLIKYWWEYAAVLIVTEWMAIRNWYCVGLRNKNSREKFLCREMKNIESRKETQDLPKCMEDSWKGQFDFFVLQNFFLKGEREINLVKFLQHTHK